MKGVLGRREIPETEQILLQAAENTSYFRAVFQNKRAVKTGSCPHCFERQGAQAVQQLFMPIAKSAPSDAFLSLNQKREPARCPSPFGVKELGWCRAATPLFELLSFVLLFNKPKKPEKKVQRTVQPLNTSQKMQRRSKVQLPDIPWFD